MKNPFSITVRPGCIPRVSMQLATTVFILSLSGCANLPDLSGYTAATDQLRQSIKSAGDSVATEIDLLSFAFKESGGASETIKTLQNVKANFQKHWEYRNKAMTAIVGYASSLEEIANAGKEGGKSAKELGDSIEGLLKTIGVIPGGNVVGVAKETIEFVYSQVAKIRAQDSLYESLSETGPIMREIVKVIEKDSEALQSSFEIALDARIGQLKRDNESVRSGGERDDLIKLRTYRNKALIEKLKKPDSDQYSKKIKDLMQDIFIIDNRLSILNSEWNAYRAELQELQKRRRVGLGLIQSLSKALRAWKTTHVKLAKAVKEKKSLDIHEVMAATSDIHALVKKWGEL